MPLPLPTKDHVLHILTGSTLRAPMEPLPLASLLEREREARELDRAIGGLVEQAAAVGVAVERALDQARVAGGGACLHEQNMALRHLLLVLVHYGSAAIQIWTKPPATKFISGTKIRL